MKIIRKELSVVKNIEHRDEIKGAEVICFDKKQLELATSGDFGMFQLFMDEFLETRPILAWKGHKKGRRYQK